MIAAYFAWRSGLYKPPDGGKRMREVLDWVVENWRKPDSGIWEVRGGYRNFVYGKAMLWLALDRGIQIFEGLNLEGDIKLWRETKDIIREEIMTKGWSTKLNAFKQSFEDDYLDAVNLMLPLMGFIDAKDPRMLSTIDATMKNLVVNGLCYRYNEAPVGVAGKEATFTLCTFWLVSALIMAGRVEEARKIYDNLLAKASPLGLFAEELDPDTGRAHRQLPPGLLSSRRHSRRGHLRVVRWGRQIGDGGLGSGQSIARSGKRSHRGHQGGETQSDQNNRPTVRSPTRRASADPRSSTFVWNFFLTDHTYLRKGSRPRGRTIRLEF